MALGEVIVFVQEAMCVSGTLLFHSTIAAAWITWEAVRLLCTFVIGSFEYIFTLFLLIGMLIVQAVNGGFPLFRDILQHLGSFVQTAIVYCINASLDFSIWVWTSPASVTFRDNAVHLVKAGAVGAVEVAAHDPLLTTRVVMFLVSLVLVVAYRRELHHWFMRTKIRCRGMIYSAKNQARLGGKRLTHWILAPFRLVARAPSRVASTAADAAGSIRQKVVACRPEFRMPSLRAKSHPEKEVSMETLKSQLAQTQTRLEEEHESKLCIICQSNQRDVVCMPCKHFATCEDCTSLLPTNILSRKVCPVCRTQINSTIKVYL